MPIRQATADDRPAIWPFLREIVAASDTRAVGLWKALGFEILATIPEGFEHPADGFVGLHVMYRRL